MVIETIDEREQTSRAVLETLRTRTSTPTYADDIAKALESDGIDIERTLWTIWRLIDENRLFLDDAGHLVIEMPERGE